MPLPPEFIYRCKSRSQPNEDVTIPLYWKPGWFPKADKLWVRKGPQGAGNGWESMGLEPAPSTAGLPIDWNELATVSYVRAGTGSGLLPLQLMARLHDEDAFPLWITSFELELPDRTLAQYVNIDNSIHSGGGSEVVFGSRGNVVINDNVEAQWKDVSIHLSWRLGLSPFFTFLRTPNAVMDRQGLAALLRRGTYTAQIATRHWSQQGRGFSLLEPAATQHRPQEIRELTPLPEPVQHQNLWLAAAMTKDLTVGRLHLHDDEEGSHWPLGWRLEEVAPGLSKEQLARELHSSDRITRERAERSLDVGHLDMSRRYGVLSWDPENGVEGKPTAAAERRGDLLEVCSLSGDRTVGPWEVRLSWCRHMRRATLQLHRQTVIKAPWLTWFWARLPKPTPDDATDLPERLLLWFPWDWRGELEPKMFGAGTKCFDAWGRIPGTRLLWALDDGFAIGLFDEDEMPTPSDSAGVLHG